MSKEELKWVDNICTGINTPDVAGYAIVRNGIVESYPIPHEFNDIIKELLRRLNEIERLTARADKYRQFADSCSCYYAEGVEFMTKAEIYEAIKREVKQLEGKA